jgi:hypothetical protein
LPPHELPILAHAGDLLIKVVEFGKKDTIPSLPRSIMSKYFN